MMHCHELLFPSCHLGIKGQSSLTLIKEVGSFQMRVTIQVCIKQLNPRIPPSIAHGSAPLAHKFNIFCHTH